MSERRPPAPFALSSEAQRLEPLDGASVLVNVVVNLEHWTLDRPMPRAALPAPGGLTVVPDVANHSWVLYGLRAGLPRLAEALAPLGSAVTVALNADVIDHYPQVADLVEARGWEVVAHGVRQQSIQSYEAEEPVIAEALTRIEARFGRPRGWLSPGMNQTDDSLSLMRAAGLEFNHDWMVDDRPVWLGTDHGPILGLPYTLTLNDVTTYQVGLQPDGTLEDRALRTLDRHTHEAARNPLVMPIGLHPHIMGVPHRIGELERIASAVASTVGVAAVTSSQIHDWYAAQVPAP
ncbi:polysaccharide deacetylase family protein [Nocardioides sp. cx-173]|uniref:polysaccharide deacetylase family protein n=1 Tax=Nocardioides sp. cx-173 TaxID=2898796 RepID=UPI001E546AEF|nr:polysaccharide deacetylase family protein [Nocardioides sp. cx-173]MCD4524030.1 polysaccharide deacetylase family protein [Nocardioides sp. cx-173]UGB41431.1 polysaccharide deacetylase family protein [Nocardioides sp. cx-173]